MNRVVRVLLPALLALAPVAIAAPAAASAPISVRYQGSLKDALQKIAEKGGISLVVVGNLDMPADVYLTNKTPEEALQAVAHAYHLTLVREGSIWTVTVPSATPGATNAPAKTEPKPAEASENAEDQAQEAEDQDQQTSDEDEAESAPTPPTPPPAPRGVPGTPPRIQLNIPFGSNDVSGTGSQVVPAGTKVDSAQAVKGNLTIDGEVSGEAVAFAGHVTVNGRVHGDVTAFGGNVVLGPHGEIDGDVTAFGGRIIRAPGSVVRGDQTSIGGPAVGSLVAQGIRSSMQHVESLDMPREHHHHGGASLAFLLLQFVVFFGVGFLFMIFAPSPMKKIEGDVSRNPLLGIVTGFFALLGLTVLSVLLGITVIGIPLVIVMWLAVAVGLAMGFTAVAHEIGIRVPVLRGKKTQAIVLALGVVLLLAVEVVPVLGTIVLFVLAMLALGAIIRTRFGTRPKGFPEPV